MKLKLSMLIALIFATVTLQAQVEPSKPEYVGDIQLVAVTPSIASKMSELTLPEARGEAKDGRYSKIRRPKREIIAGKGSTGDLLSENPHPLTGTVKGRSADVVWDAGYTGSNPTDPALAVGPDHVFVVWNTAFAIFDKDGTELVGNTNPFPAIFPSNGCCDLTVSYDNAADRWVISFLGGGAQIAVSQTGNPVTTDWNIYNIGSVNDYNKLSVWSDGYYLTDQSGGNRLYAMDRDAMLAGDATASIQGFQLPGIGTFGFASPQALNVSDGNMPAAGNAPVVFFQDDSYGGITEDHIKFWSANVDFATPGNSSITAPQEIPVTPFTSIFDGGSFSNLPQPNGGQLLDALQGIIMNQAQFRKFPTYNAAVFNHVIDIDPSSGKRAAVRWYEFRQASDGAPWALFQEGTYSSPDGKHAWNASLMMDGQGNIGMGYTAMSVQGNGTTEVGSYYTGRFISDPPGVMSVIEDDIAIGDGPIQGGRYGDYSKIDIDPSDDATFYFTNEVHTADTPNANLRAANVGRFKIAADSDIDTGVIAIVSPTDGDLTTTETVAVIVRNFGTVAQSNVEVSFTIDGGTTVTEIVAGPIPPASNVNYTFTATADMSVDGQTYNLCARTDLPGDETSTNDEVCQDITSLNDNNTGVVAITSPTSGTGLSNAEVITVTIENFGAATQTSIPVFYTLDGGTPVNESYTGSIVQGATETYSFTATADLSALGTYTIVTGTELAGDSDETNDDITVDVSNFICQPESDCEGFGDGVTQIELADQNINVDCSSTGYTDNTDVVFNFVLNDNPFDGTLQMGFADSEFALWIDFNDNNSFEADELVVNELVANADSDFNFTIDFSALSGVTTGMHLMRLRGEDESTAGDVTDPCEDLQFGRTNDYTANVTGVLGFDDSPFADANFVISSQDQNYFDLTFNSTSYTNDLPVYIYNTLGQTLAYYTLEHNGTGFNKTIDMSYVPSGVYFVKIGTESLNKVKRIIVK